MRSPEVSPCASDDFVEAYCMRRMSPSRACSFEEHFLFCASCAALVEQTQAFLDTLRCVACRLDQRRAS
jgi:hypothetical protein